MPAESLNYDVLDIATSEQKDSIAAIDILKIGAAQRAFLALVELGVKPASDIQVFPWNDPPEKVVQVIMDARLKIEEKQRVPVESGEAITYAVARDNETLKRLMQTDPDVGHSDYGNLMGFPETATAVFGTDAVLSEDDLTVDEKQDIQGLAVHFKMSRDHWKDEVKLLRYWTNLLKKYAPKTYADLVRV